MKTRTKIFVFAALALLVLAASAGAVKKVEKVHLRAGDIVIDGYGGFKPETLPKHKNAPITIYGGGKISTISGNLPPILDELNFEFDRHGAVETRGLDVCTQGKLVATDVKASRKACGGAIIGKGFGSAVVKFPEQAPIPASSPLTFFNGPKKHGNETVLVHGHLDVPAPTTYIVPIEIKRVNNGVYGYRVEVDIPVLAGGNGVPISGRATIGKKWTYKGKKLSYVNARCETGRLQARGEFSFTDSTLLRGNFLRPCKVRS